MNVLDVTSTEIAGIRNAELLDAMSLHGRHGWDFSVSPSRSVFEGVRLLTPVTPAGELIVAGVGRIVEYYSDQESLLAAPPDALLSFAWPVMPRQVPTHAAVLTFEDVRAVAKEHTRYIDVVVNRNRVRL